MAAVTELEKPVKTTEKSVANRLENGTLTFGNPGRPKGIPNKAAAFREFLFEMFVKNQAHVEKHLNAMFQERPEFKWLMQNVYVPLCPKPTEGSEPGPSTSVIIVRSEKKEEPVGDKTTTVPGQVPI